MHQKILSDKKLNSQTNICINAINFLLKESLINKRPADKVISFFFRQNKQLGSRDRRLILELSFPILRWWGWLIYLIPNRGKVLSSHKHSESDPEAKFIQDKLMLKLILAAATIQDDHLIPESLIKYWMKKLQFSNIIKNNKQMSTREKGKFFFETFELGEFKNNYVYELLPPWIQEEIPAEINLEQLIDFCQKRPPMWLRLQCKDFAYIISKFKFYGFTLNTHPTIKNAIALHNPKINLYSIEEFQKGMFEVQDLASQAIGLICSPMPGERWWDPCAGAGGKSLQLASFMNNKGRIVASDIREYKLEDLKKRARRAKFSNIAYSGWNGRKLSQKKKEKFDGVLVDAPCTCSGTWRRNPDAKWKITKEEIDEISILQLKLLSNASEAVRPGAVLVYATCSIFLKENGSVVKQFLKNNDDFSLEAFDNPLTGEKTNGTLQVLPWDGNCDATYIAKFRKKNS